MIVAAILHGYPFSYLNGASLTSRDLLTALVRKGHTVNVYTIQEEEYRIDNGVSVYRYDPRNLPLADIVYTHPDLGNFGVKVAMKNQVPLVGFVHNYLFSTYQSIENYRGRYHRLYFNSKYTREHVGFEGMVIRPPFKSANYRVTNTGDKITLINMWEGKGGTIFWKLSKMMDYAPFLGVKGYGTQLLNESSDNVEVRDIIEHPKMKTVYRDTKVLLMPSETEGWGRVGIEAMCSGIPVITSGVGGIQEALGDSATYIQVHYLDRWKQELDRLLTDQVYYDERSQRCKEHVRQLEKEVKDDLNIFIEDIEQICNKQ